MNFSNNGPFQVFNGPEITMPKDCRHWKPPQEGLDGIASFWEHRFLFTLFLSS
jgi:hypothetical protein